MSLNFVLWSFTANRSRFSFKSSNSSLRTIFVQVVCAFFFPSLLNILKHFVLTLCLSDSLFVLLEVRAFLHISSNLMNFFCIQAHKILTLEESSPSKENADICGHVLHEPHNPSLCLLPDPVVDFLEVQLRVATQCPQPHLVGLLELAVKSRPCPESWGIKTWILQLAALSKQSQGSRWQCKAQQQVSHKISVAVCLQKPALKNI